MSNWSPYVAMCVGSYGIAQLKLDTWITHDDCSHFLFELLIKAHMLYICLVMSEFDDLWVRESDIHKLSKW